MYSMLKLVFPVIPIFFAVEQTQWFFSRLFAKANPRAIDWFGSTII